METTSHDGFSATARDHAEHPRNNAPMADADGHGRITGPCGDTMDFWVGVHGQVITRVSFVTDGCGSSHAAGSMATCLALGRTLADASSLTQQDVLDALGGFPEGSRHCALLAANTLRAACADVAARASAGGGAQRGQTTCGTCSDGTCADAAAHGAGGSGAEHERLQRMAARLAGIRRKIMVVSGKGGVGKSTVAVNTAVSLAASGHRVGLLDVDLHGPAVPAMLGLASGAPDSGENGLLPAESAGVKVMSLGFFLENPDDPVIWSGAVKLGVIGQMLRDVEWGDLDFLIIDCPPGTGDEPLSVSQHVGALDGAIVVTTPQKVAEGDVRRAITFCRQLRVPVLGIVENMAGFACPHCGAAAPILPSGAAARIARDMNVPHMASIPVDAAIAEACDNGRPFVLDAAGSPAAAAIRTVADTLAALVHTNSPASGVSQT